MSVTAPTSASVSAAQPLRNLNFLSGIWQGGALMGIDRVTNFTNGVPTKSGYMDILGNIASSTGLSFQSKPKSAEFLVATSSGVATSQGKPISQLDAMFQVKIDSPSVQAASLALFGGTATTVSQTAISSDVTNTSISAVVLDVWYPVGAQALTKFAANNGSSTTYTESTDGGVTGDYLLDTEAGFVKFLSSGTVTAASQVAWAYQAAALTNQPYIGLRTNPRYTMAGIYAFMVIAENEARNAPEVWMLYMPVARIEPTGNFDINSSKPAEITLDITGIQSNEIANAPFGYLKQIDGTMRSIV